MPIGTFTKRLTKGSGLTFAEGDGNLDLVANFVNALETRMDVSLNADGTVKDQRLPFASTLVGTDAYAVNIGGTYAAIGDLLGRIILVKIDVANTGPATLAVNSFTATAIKKFGVQDLASGDLKPGIAAFVYDTTNAVFNLLNPGTNSKENYSATTNSTNDYTATISSLSSSSFEVPAAYYAGFKVQVKINTTNTGAARLKIASTTPAIDLGFADIRKNGATALAGGELQANQIYTLIHDGTNWQLQGTGFAITTLPGFYSALSPSGDCTTLIHTWPHGLGAIPSLVRVVIKNLTTDQSYAVDDEIEVSGMRIDGTGLVLACMSADATNIKLHFSSGAMAVTTKGTSNYNGIDETKWKPKAYAWL